MPIPSFAYRIKQTATAALKPYPRNARKHSKRQVKQIAASIKKFGFTNPVLVGDDGEIIAGHRRVHVRCGRIVTSHRIDFMRR